MLTIRKKLAEQAAAETSGERKGARKGGNLLERKMSIRSQLLVPEASELEGIIPS